MTACERCGGAGLEFADWMGPTPEAPYPRACRDCSPNLTPREIQIVQTQWLLDNQHRKDVQQILARTAVHEAQHYRQVLRLGWKVHNDSSLLPTQEMARSDLVVDAAGKVLKDRYGAVGYKLSETELRRIAQDCDEYVDLPF